MTARFIDSFDTVSTMAQIGARYTNFTAGNGGWSTNGRRGTGCLDFNHAGAAGKVALALDYQETWIVGHALYINNMPAGGIILELDDDDPDTVGTPQVRLFLASGAFVVRDANGNILGISGPSIVTTGRYYYVEFKATISHIGSIEVRVDGVSVISETGVDTSFTGNTADRFRISGSAKQYVDDLYVLDGSGGSDNDFWGDTIITAVFPTSDGSTLQWTPSTGGTHYTLIDESSPDTSDYVDSSTPTNLDTYKFVSPASITVKALQQVMWSGTTSGTGVIKGEITSSGSNFYTSDRSIITTAKPAFALWAVNPATSAAWTESQINAAEFGVYNVS